MPDRAQRLTRQQHGHGVFIHIARDNRDGAGFCCLDGSAHQDMRADTEFAVHHGGRERGEFVFFAVLTGERLGVHHRDQLQLHSLFRG